MYLLIYFLYIFSVYSNAIKWIRLCMYILYVFSQYNYEKIYGTYVVKRSATDPRCTIVYHHKAFYMKLIIIINNSFSIFFSSLKRKHLKPSYMA